MHDLIDFVFERLEMRDLDTPHALHGADQGRVHADAAAVLHVFPQLLQCPQHPGTVEALPLTVFAKAHRGSPVEDVIMSRARRRMTTAGYDGAGDAADRPRLPRMLSNETLQATFGLTPTATRHWGDVIRAVSTTATCLIAAAMIVIYSQTARNTIAIRHLQDYGMFDFSARQLRAGAELMPRRQRSSSRTGGGRSI